MSRISQELANRIANKMTEKFATIVAITLRSYQQLVTEIYKSHIPKDVLVFYQKNKAYCKRTEFVKLNGHGFQHEYIALTEVLPTDSNGSTYFDYTPSEAAKMTTAKRKWEKSEKEYKELRKETEQALLALKTFNNIRKELPQAAEFLPPPMSNALIVNFDSLHKKLKAQDKLPTTAKETVTN